PQGPPCAAGRVRRLAGAAPARSSPPGLGRLFQAGPDGLDEQPGAVVVQVLPDVADYVTERDAALRVAVAERPAAPRMAERGRAAERSLLRREHESRGETAGYQQHLVDSCGLLGHRAGQRRGVQDADAVDLADQAGVKPGEPVRGADPVARRDL